MVSSPGRAQPGPEKTPLRVLLCPAHPSCHSFLFAGHGRLLPSEGNSRVEELASSWFPAQQLRAAPNIQNMGSGDKEVDKPLRKLAQRHPRLTV